MIQRVDYKQKIQEIYNDTYFYSSFNPILEHQVFKYLVTFDKTIVPYIIEDLKNNDELCWIHILLLASIVKDDEYIKEKQQNPDLPGKFRNHVEMWLGWWYFKQRQEKLFRILKKDTF